MPPGDPTIHCVFMKNGKEFRFTSLIFLFLAILKECIFKKTSDTTGLRVFWNGNLRLSGCHHCCRRWYFTLNGAECSTPGAIDGVVYMINGANKNLHRPRHIEGVCEKIHKGTVRGGFWVGNCAGFGSANGFHRLELSVPDIRGRSTSPTGLITAEPKFLFHFER